jgi:hypothetical protein
MARPLNADRTSARSLSAALGVIATGTFPGPSVYPGGIGGGVFPTSYPGSATFPSHTNYLYPGRGVVISLDAVSARTLTGVPA